MALSRVNSKMVGAGDVSNAEHAYLNSISSNVQTQITGNNLPAVGSSGNVLTSDGTNWASTAPAGGGGMWTAGSSGSFSGANSAAWTSITQTTRIFITNYEKSASSGIRMRTSSNGGSSYDSASNSYSSSLFGLKGNSSSMYTDVRQNSISSVQNDGADNAAGTVALDDVTLDIIIWNPQDATKRTKFTWTYYASLTNGGAATDIQYGVGSRSANHAVNAFQIHGTTGNISGSYQIYTLS